MNGILKNPAWGLQTDWWIDAVNGNDRNTGDLVGAPIRTWAEFARRLEDVVIQPVGGVTTVHVLGAGTPATDPYSANLTIGNGCRVVILGVLANILHSGTLTAAGASVPAANTAAHVSDGALVWAPFVNKRLRMTAGPNVGAMGWIAKDLGAGQARMSLAVQSDNTGFLPNLTATTYTTNTYVVESLPAIVFGSPTVRGINSGLRPPPDAPPFIFPILIFDNLAIAPGGPPLFGTSTLESAYIDAPSANIAFTNCELPIGIGIGDSLFSFVQNSWAKVSTFEFGVYVDGGCLMGVTAGGFYSDNGNTQGAVRGDTTIQYDGECLFQGTGLLVDAAASVCIGGIAIFDSNPAGFGIPQDAALHVGNYPLGNVQGGIIMVAAVGLTVPATIYGSGNAGVGLKVSAGGQFFYDGTAVFAITGAGGEFRVGQAGLALPNFDPATGLPGAAVNQTWANLAGALPGGFGGLARNLANNAQIALNA